MNLEWLAGVSDLLLQVVVESVFVTSHDGFLYASVVP